MLRLSERRRGSEQLLLGIAKEHVLMMSVVATRGLSHAERATTTTTATNHSSATHHLRLTRAGVEHASAACIARRRGRR